MREALAEHKTRLYLLFGLVFIAIAAFAFYYYLHTPEPMVKIMNLKYGVSTKQRLDIYLPKVQNGKKLPVIIYVHGGGWTGGDKGNVDSKPSYFIKNGYVFVSVNHRLSPTVSYDVMADDVSLAVKWIYDHAGQYHIDKKKINLMGHSSGGHLLMLIGTNPKYMNKVGLSISTVNSLVNLEGPLNLTDFIQRMGGYKKVFGINKRIWAEASPETYAETKNLPPMFLVARSKNSISAFMQTAKQTGNHVEYFESKSLSHSAVTQKLGDDTIPGEAKNMTNAVTAFLKKYNFDK